MDDGLKRKIAAGLAALGASAGILVSFIARNEGAGPYKIINGQKIYIAYPDPGKGWALPTICKGHTRDVTRETTATAQQCEAWLQEDLAIATADTLHCMKRTDEPGPLRAMVDLQYNSGGACQSQAARHYNAGNCAAAAWELFGAPQLDANGRPKIWDGTRIMSGRPVRLDTPLTINGRVLLRVGQPIPKWTTGGGLPLPGLFLRAEARAKWMLQGCTQPKGPK